jgi:hypothetical protein
MVIVGVVDDAAAKADPRDAELFQANHALHILSQLPFVSFCTSQHKSVKRNGIEQVLASS